MKRKTGSLLAIASLLVWLGLGSFAAGNALAAESPDPGHHDGMGHGHGRHGGGLGALGILMFGPLDLSTAQQHAIVDIMAKHKADLKGKWEQVHKAKMAMMQAMHQDSPDRQAVSSAFDQAASARKQFMLARLDLRQEIMGVLTADQKAKLKKFREEHMKQMEGMHAHGDD